MKSSFQSFCMRFHAFACSGVRIVLIRLLYLSRIAFSDAFASFFAVSLLSLPL